MTDRIRHPRTQKLHVQNFHFINPYPEMGSAEARVRLALEELRLPFSWRYFDGVSPTTTALIPDFAPEYTLREYRTVIMVNSTYFGSLPGVLDRTALAKAALEADGWHAIILWDTELSSQSTFMLLKDRAPWLLTGTIKGEMRPNPFNPNFMQRFREKLQQRNFARSKPGIKEGSIRDRRNQRRIRRGLSRSGIRAGGADARPSTQGSRHRD